ncbi:MAG: lectin-like domain-containing protein [Enterococcus casseliflavus]
MPIDETLITTVGQAGSPQGSDGYNYVQINDGVTSNVSGGVWFNKAVSFTRSFRLEMAFCIENTATDSDGLTFVMQSSGVDTHSLNKQVQRLVFGSNVGEPTH